MKVTAVPKNLCTELYNDKSQSFKCDVFCGGVGSSTPLINKINNKFNHFRANIPN